MFSGRYPLVRDKENRYFIDADGIAFGYILNFLRRDIMLWPTEKPLLNGLLNDLNFFGIQYPSPFEESQILKRGNGLPRIDLHIILEEFFPELSGCKLIYNASVDGWESNAFHKNCDNVENTLVLIQVEKYIFGGFATNKWNQVHPVKSNYCDPSSFLFSLSNPTNSFIGVKFPNIGVNSNYCNPNLGPCFGSPCTGFDILIESQSGTCDIGKNYKHPLHLQNTPEAFCGSGYFTPTNIEVFALTFFCCSKTSGT